MKHICYTHLKRERKFYWVDDEQYDRKLVHRRKFNIRKAVKCSVAGCGKIAEAIDHFYPYHDENNRCKRHLQEALKK